MVLGEEKAIHVTETLLGGQWEKQAQSRRDRDSICTPSSAQGNQQEGETGQDGEAREGVSIHGKLQKKNKKELTALT